MDVDVDVVHRWSQRETEVENKRVCDFKVLPPPEIPPDHHALLSSLRLLLSFVGYVGRQKGRMDGRIDDDDL